MEITLYCSKCQTDKAKEEFYRNKSMKKREYNYWCKECEKEHGKIKTECECGLQVSKGNMYHKRSDIHTQLIKKLRCT